MALPRRGKAENPRRAHMLATAKKKGMRAFPCDCRMLGDPFCLIY